MSTWVWFVVAVAVAILLVALVLAAARSRRTSRLRRRFGPEYERTVEAADNRRDAERALAEREKRHDALELRPLTAVARERYAEQWRMTQERFVDKPAESVEAADTLVTTVMRERGYPVDDFDRRADDISVDHPHVVEDYRAAQAIARTAALGDASTEELRQAMVHYRSLFDELLVADEDAPMTREPRTEGEPAATRDGAR